jgi:hypothetical protein
MKTTKEDRDAMRRGYDPPSMRMSLDECLAANPRDMSRRHLPQKALVSLLDDADAYARLRDGLEELIRVESPNPDNEPSGRVDFEPGTDCCWSTSKGFVDDIRALLEEGQ